MRKLIAIALLAGLSTPAFAGGKMDPPSEPYVPAPEPVHTAADWTGFYGGATLGVGRISGDNGRETGIGAGVHAGYNVDMGNWVAGGELGVAPGFNQSAAGREIQWGASARLRAGPKLDDAGRLWGFGTVGLSHVRHEADGGGDGRSDNGWVAGVGVSHLTEGNMIMTGELLHSRNRGGGASGTGVALGVSFRF